MNSVTAASGYNALVVEHFERPRNVGLIAAGADTIEGVAGRMDQGTQFKLTARIEAGRIVAARFEAYGCPHCIAAASYLTERLRGATRGDLEQWSWRELAAVLDVPTAKRGRLLVLEDAVRALAADWRGRF